VTGLRSLHINDQREWRGGERQTLLLAQALHAAGHGVAVVAHPDGELIRRAQTEGLETFPLEIRSDVSPRAVRELRGLIDHWRPDVVHAHTPHAHSTAQFARRRAACRPALVVSRRVDRSIHRWPLGLSLLKYRHGIDRIIAISGAVKRRLVSDGVPAEMIGCVLDGLDPGLAAATTPADLAAEFGFPPGAVVMATVAALDRSKGHHVILQAAPTVLASHPNAKFLFIGDGPEKTALQQQVDSLGLTAAVTFAGFRDDVLPLVAATDLFVMPSLSEGLCTSVIDAMFLRKPAVVSSAGGLPELVADRERGRVTPVEDARALADAILEVLNDPAGAQRWVAQAYEWASGHVTTEAMMQGTLREYAIAMGR